MKSLHFDYYMELEYSPPVRKCHFTIKCIPQDTSRQKVERISIDVTPCGSMAEGYDSFGNKQLFGCVEEDHERFQYHIEGVVRTGLADCEPVENENILGIYRYPHGLTVPGEGLKAYLEKLHVVDGLSDFDKGVFLMHSLYRDFSYEKNVTDVTTTAEQAWQLGRGVCQDYAQILITLCRMEGIPARYVTGMLIAEGYSHAWVEILCGHKWYGLDPTNDLIVDDEHIRIGVGRDAADCLINRGIMTGGGKQTQRIRVLVEEKYD